METNKEMQELEQMRAQLNILKQKLQTQEIVSDQLLRSTMRSRMSWINKYRWIALMSIPFVGLCFLPATVTGQFPWWFYGFTMLMVSVSAISDFIVNRLSGSTIMNSSLVELSQKLVEMKRLRRLELLIGIPFVIVWIAWMMFEIHNSSEIMFPDNHSVGTAFMIVMGIGALIGGAIGLSIYLKMQRTNDELIRQIKDITNENME